MSTEPDYRAMWEGLKSALDAPCVTGVVGDYAAGFLLTFMEGGPREPDPTYTPAVRRVVAWEHRGELFRDINSAYAAAAIDRMTTVASSEPSARRLRRRVTALEDADGGKGFALWARVRDRLASLLRHRDEKAGYR